MNQHPRLEIGMNIIDSITAMSAGNPGAISVMCMLVKRDEIGFGDILHLDDMEIYGSDIWICFKDICKQDINELSRKIKDRSIKNELEKLEHRGDL